MYDRFYPGRVWLDTEGKRIQAHGGSVIAINGKYYWYGENKEFTDGKNGTWHNGVRMYESTDLYNWKDLGVIIPVSDDPESPLYPSTCMDRPHIIYNKTTRKYVCWIKVMRAGRGQLSSVLTADCITGPYTMVHQDFKPLGMSAGDFDLVVASDGKAYYYFERVHSETICADLTEDYTDVTGYYSTHFPHHEGPPYVREATAHFVRNNKHYLITSGTTGYWPNPSEVAVSDTWHGPFTVLGNPHPGDESHTSYHSQITSVFKVPGKKDLYIALADRWRPMQMDVSYETVEKLYATICTPTTPQSEKQEAIAQMTALGSDGSNNTSIADYVWLPFTFENGMPTLHWYDEWKIEDFE